MAVCSPIPLLPPVMTETELVGDLRFLGFTVKASVAIVSFLLEREGLQEQRSVERSHNVCVV